METICRTPRGALPIAVALFAFGVSGCSIIFPPGGGCPSIEDMCPNLECAAGFVVSDDGCALCECAETEPEPKPEPEACWHDGDCADGELCFSTRGTDASPPSPPVASDAGPAEPMPPPPPDDDDESGDRACEPNADGSCGDVPPAEPPSGAPGVCLPAACPAIAIACPEGSEVVTDYSQDPCGDPRCVVVDECRALDTDTCSVTPGCRVETLPTDCGCGPGGGDRCAPCSPEVVCVSDEVICEQLSEDECLSHAECELVYNGGAAPCFQECDEAGNCWSGCDERPAPSDAGVEDPPEGEGYCVTRWTPPPPPPGECAIDSDCPAGQFCQIADECGSLCDPSSNEPCQDVCIVIGFCQDDDQPPPGCSIDDDCGAGFVCEQTEVCSCSGSGGSDGAAPPEEDPMPCLEECHLEGQCVWSPDNVRCYSDGECGEDQRCDFFDSCVAPPDCPNCLIACEGVCVDIEPAPTTCLSDDECSTGETCDLVNYCEAGPGCDAGVACLPVCYGRCIAPEPPASSDRCLEPADCAEGFRCASEVDSCYCPDGDTCEVCYWQCVAEDPDAP